MSPSQSIADCFSVSSRCASTALVAVEITDYCFIMSNIAANISISSIPACVCFWCKSMRACWRLETLTSPDTPPTIAVLLCAAFTSAVSGTVHETEWGMVGLGIILGAAFALIMGFVFHLVSEYWRKGKMSYLTHNQSGCFLQTCSAWLICKCKAELMAANEN